VELNYNLAPVKGKPPEIVPPEYSEEELLFFGGIIRQLNDAWNQRQQSYTELDDMSYDQWYIANKKASLGYIPPKVNRQDVRVVSGTTREKTNTLLNAVMRYNYGVSVEAFDENDIPNMELGETIADLVSKTRELECVRYDVKRPLFLHELLSQGTAFLRENWVENMVIRKRLEDIDPKNFLKAKWEDIPEVGEKYCDTQLLPGYTVYLGNIREFYIQKQPYIGAVRQLTRAEAESIYGKWARWKNVPIDVKHTIAGTLSQQAMPYEGFYMTNIMPQITEEITYYNVWTNTIQIMLNGIMMLPVGFPLEYLFGRIEYPIVKADIEPISSNFAYSRGVPAKTKFSQALIDEMYRAIILKTRKSFEPPLANNTGKLLSKNILYPGHVQDGVDPTKIQEIGNNQGVTNPEMAAVEFIKKIIDESSVSPVFEGQSAKGQQTAREVMELQKQSLMRLGLTIIGVINMETELVWKRIWNICKHWTEPVGSEQVKIGDEVKKLNKYRTASMPSIMPNGVMGQKLVEFTDQGLPHPNQVSAEAKLLSEKFGKPVTKVYLSPEDLKNIKYTFKVKITPTEKDPSELKAIMFEESILKANQIWPGQLNNEFAQHEWAIHQHLNPDKLFIKAQPMQAGIPIPNEGTSALGAQAIPQVQRKPSLIKTLQGQ
jgi:hypothetical protein